MIRLPQSHHGSCTEQSTCNTPQQLACAWFLCFSLSERSLWVQRTNIRLRSGLGSCFWSLNISSTDSLEICIDTAQQPFGDALQQQAGQCQVCIPAEDGRVVNLKLWASESCCSQRLSVTQENRGPDLWVRDKPLSIEWRLHPDVGQQIRTLFWRAEEEKTYCPL